MSWSVRESIKQGRTELTTWHRSGKSNAEGGFREWKKRKSGERTTREDPVQRMDRKCESSEC